MFFIVALTMLVIIHGYVGFKIIPAIDLSGISNIIAWVLLSLVTFLPIAPIGFRFLGIETKLIDKVSLLGYTSLGFFAFTFIILIFKEMLVFAILGFEKVLPYFSKSSDLINDDRREFLQKSLSVGVLAITTPSAVYGYHQARKGPRVIEQEIKLGGKLPGPFNGLTIAQISDLHVGPTIKKGYVENVVDKISRINPDMIVVTGDLIDGSIKHLRNDLAPLGDLNALHGVYFVTGNHEYYSGVDYCLDHVDKLGMTNLINENILITKNKENIVLAGITDFSAGNIKPSHFSNPALALNGVSKDLVRILLAHQPNSIHDVHKAGADLQISGHTHGGQFWPFNIPTSLANAYLAGHYDHLGTQIYVNRGTGYWGPPLRIGIPSEITLFKLFGKK